MVGAFIQSAIQYILSATELAKLVFSGSNGVAALVAPATLGCEKAKSRHTGVVMAA